MNATTLLLMAEQAKARNRYAAMSRAAPTSADARRLAARDRLLRRYAQLLRERPVVSGAPA